MSKTEKVKPPKVKCIGICGRPLTRSNANFYKSKKDDYIDNDGFLNICKDCLRNMCINEDNTPNLDGIKDALKILDKPLIKNEYMKLITNGTFSLGDYTKVLNLRHKDLRYEDSDFDKEIVNEVKNGITNELIKIEASEDDIKAQEDIKRLLGYDPFLDYEPSDKIYLCNELIPYLDEDTLEDPFKCNVILQIVNNNNHIRKANIAINSLSSSIELMVKNSKEISSLTDISTKINGQNDRLSKENNIALKHRAGANSKNSTLGSMMKNLRELGFEKAEHDYYDMSKSYGMQVSADISNKSIIQILNFDDNDTNNLFKMQREELQRLQNLELDYKEELRKMYVENTELKNKIKELENQINI